MKQEQQAELFPLLAAKAVHDICIRRARGNKHSKAANLIAAGGKNSMRERLRIYIGGCDYEGATLKELCAVFEKLPNEISGRISELRAKGLIFDSGRTRDKRTGDIGAVYVGQLKHVNGSAEEKR